MIGVLTSHLQGKETPEVPSSAGFTTVSQEDGLTLLVRNKYLLERDHLSTKIFFVVVVVEDG